MSSNPRQLLGVLSVIMASSLGRAGEPLSVFVSIAPQAFFVERIGGDRVEVQVLVPPAQSPATYTVSASQMAALSEAQVYFRVGVPFENTLLPKLRSNLPELRVANSAKNVKLRAMTEPHTCYAHKKVKNTCSHSNKGEHGAGTMDPHIWLDPLRVITQVATVRDVLAELDPPGAAVYDKNFTIFSKELSNLQAELQQALEPCRGKTFMVFHPAFGYFADAFGLKQEPIEIEGKTPSARQLAAIIDAARAEGVKVIFVQPQFDRRTARSIAQSINGAIVPIDPMARDYIKNLRRITARVKKGLDR